jgi:hypothetical protein
MIQFKKWNKPIRFKCYYLLWYFSWIEHKIRNPTELVSWILDKYIEIWISKVWAEFEKEKGFKEILGHGPNSALRPGSQHDTDLPARSTQVALSIASWADPQCVAMARARTSVVVCAHSTAHGTADDDAPVTQPDLVFTEELQGVGRIHWATTWGPPCIAHGNGNRWRSF